MAKKVFSEKATAVLQYLQGNPESNLTQNELADILGFAHRSMTGVITALVRKGLVLREEVEDAETGKTIKIITITSEGLAVDPEAEVPTKAEEAEA